MAKSNNKSTKSTAKTAKAKTTKSEVKPNEVEQPVSDGITQPDKSNPDSQAYIKENAKQGTGVSTPASSSQGVNVEL